MGETIIRVSDDHKEPCVLYTALIANPATGKSQAMNIFNDAVNAIEVFDNKNAENDEYSSKLVTGRSYQLTCK
jgi:hypothetical protein